MELFVSHKERRRTDTVNAINHDMISSDDEEEDEEFVLSQTQTQRIESISDRQRRSAQSTPPTFHPFKVKPVIPTEGTTDGLEQFVFEGSISGNFPIMSSV